MADILFLSLDEPGAAAAVAPDAFGAAFDVAFDGAFAAPAADVWRAAPAPADPRAALDVAAAVRASHDGRAAALAGAWDEAAAALLASAERRAGLRARGLAAPAVVVRGWSDVAVLAAARQDAVGAADALARARAAADDAGRHADPAVDAALAEVGAWLASLAGARDAAPSWAASAPAPIAAVEPNAAPLADPHVESSTGLTADVELLDLGVDDDPSPADAADWSPPAPNEDDEQAADAQDVVAPSLLEDDADPFAAFDLGPAPAAEPLVVGPAPAEAPRARSALGTALALTSVLAPAPKAGVPAAAASTMPAAPAEAPERSADLTFLELEGPLRVWELPQAGPGLACAVPTPATPPAKAPLAPPLPAALRTDAPAATPAPARNAAVDAVVALTEASAEQHESGRLRSLLRRITRR